MTKTDKLAELQTLAPLPLPAALRDWLARQQRGNVELPVPARSSSLCTGVEVLLRHYRGSRRGSARNEADGVSELFLGHLVNAQDLGYYYLDVRTMEIVERSSEGEQFGERSPFTQLFD
ncbi:MAG: hypothetical protein R3F49_17425 [Planctomycetota bacterium]